MNEKVQKYLNICMHGVTVSVTHHLLHGVTSLSVCLSITEHGSKTQKVMVNLTLLRSERPKLHRVLAVLSAIGLIKLYIKINLNENVYCELKIVSFNQGQGHNLRS